MLALYELSALLFCNVLVGTIAVAFLRPAVEGVGASVLSFGLSLLVCHAVVVVLTLAGAYETGYVRGLIAVVAIVMIAVVVAAPIRAGGAVALRSNVVGIRLTVFAYTLFAAAATVLAIRAWRDFGTVFNIWDDIVSWNRWALDWAAGRWPRNTWEYPQVLPSVWSIFYVAGGTIDIQIFVKAMMAWLPLAQIVAFVAIWREEPSPGPVVAAALAAGMLAAAGIYTTAAYADIPTGTIAFIGFFAGWVSAQRNDKGADKLAWIGAAIVATAALTKQSGAFFALCYPIFLYAVTPSSPGRTRRCAVALGLGLALTLPEYCAREYLILSGRDSSAIRATVVLAHDEPFGERLHRAYIFAREWLGHSVPWMPIKISLLPVVALGCVLALVSRFGRLLILLLVVPYYLIYAFCFGYDPRNLFPVVPFAAWAAGKGYGDLVVLIHRRIRGWRPPAENVDDRFAKSASNAGASSVVALLAPPVLLALVLSARIVTWAGGWPNATFIATKQADALMDIGGTRDMNVQVVDYLRAHPDVKRLATPFLPLGVLPLVRDHYMTAAVNDQADLDKLIADRSVDLVLDAGQNAMMTSEGLQALDAAEKNGRLKRVLSGPGWRLLEIDRSNS